MASIFVCIYSTCPLLEYIAYVCFVYTRGLGQPPSQPRSAAVPILVESLCSIKRTPGNTYGMKTHSHSNDIYNTHVHRYTHTLYANQYIH